MFKFTNLRRVAKERDSVASSYLRGPENSEELALVLNWIIPKLRVSQLRFANNGPCAFGSRLVPSLPCLQISFARATSLVLFLFCFFFELAAF